MAQGAIPKLGKEFVAENGRWIEWTARMGFATKGVVYGIVGVLAVAAAWEGGRPESSEGAIRAIGQQPFGYFLLWITAVGLAAYALWRFVEAAVDPQRHGTEWKDIVRRIGYAISGVIHVGLAVYAAPGSLGSMSGDNSRKGWVAWVLSWPGGQWVVALVGLGILGYAIFELYRAWSQSFLRQFPLFAMNETEQNTAKYAGVLGLAARGLTFVIIGVFLVLAAVRLNPGQVKGLGEALEVLSEQPYGPWLLGLTGLGWVCYAIFCETRAFYQRFHIAGTSGGGLK